MNWDLTLDFQSHIRFLSPTSCLLWLDTSTSIRVTSNSKCYFIESKTLILNAHDAPGTETIIMNKMHSLPLRIYRQLENWRLAQRMHGLVMGACHLSTVSQHCNRDKDRMRQRDPDPVSRGQGGFWKIASKPNKSSTSKQTCTVRCPASMLPSQFIEECCSFTTLSVCCLGSICRTGSSSSERCCSGFYSSFFNALLVDGTEKRLFWVSVSIHREW